MAVPVYGVAQRRTPMHTDTLFADSEGNLGAPVRSPDKEEVPGSSSGRPCKAPRAEQFGSRLYVVASVDRDGSELLASQRWQREMAARARRIAMVQAETAVQLRRYAAKVLETAAELRAEALELRAQLDKEREAAGEKRRIACEERVAGQELPTPDQLQGDRRQKVGSTSQVEE